MIAIPESGDTRQSVRGRGLDEFDVQGFDRRHL